MKVSCMRLTHFPQFPWRIVALSALLWSASEPAPAQTASEPTVSAAVARDLLSTLRPAERRGLRFVRLNCARCHAIDKVGESPLAMAPPFRTLHLRYPVTDLQRPLAQGIHPVMPRFQLEAS